MGLIGFFRRERWSQRPGGRRAGSRGAHSLEIERLESRILLNSDQNAFFVNKIFQDLLHRSPDPATLLAFTQRLDEGLDTRFSDALFLESTPESRSLQVEGLYSHLLHRSADGTGLANETARLLSGGTIEQIAVDLAGSLEYFRNRGGGTDAGFLAAIYQDFLNRPIDPVGLAEFGQELAGGTSPATVVAQIVTSLEYEQDLVAGFYQQFLHRNADPGGLNGYVSLLQLGERDDIIVASLLSSEEYAPGTADTPVLTSDQVRCLLERAAAATASDDAIVAIVDRGGRILGVRVEAGVSAAITSNPEKLVFAIDGALAEARTAAFFANDQAPLTSRTVQFISQSTITQREVESDPSIPDPNSTLLGPGFVAPVGLGGHFPPNVANTPPVDLFGIEHTNRDSLMPRFNIDPANFGPLVSNDNFVAPMSYGRVSGLNPTAQPRGIGTLPGGIPLYNQVTNLIGGVGVFFPGTTGFATEENSSLSATFNPSRPDRSLEAEYIALVTAENSLGPVGGIVCPGIDLPMFQPGPNRIELNGITLDTIGPGGTQGLSFLLQYGAGLGRGNPFSGFNATLTPGQPNSSPLSFDSVRDGKSVPDGWLVLPHDSQVSNITQADVIQIIAQGIAEANLVRAQIRLPLEQRTRMVFAVADSGGNVLGLFRMADATVFSIDVAVAKARNVAYYDNPGLIQPIDVVPGLMPGIAFSARTFRFLAQPRFPEGIDGTPPAPFSILNDPGIDPHTGLDSGPPRPASVYQSIYGFDSFHPGTNFHQPANPNQNGVVFFPGSSVLYKTIGGVPVPVGGLGVSGDGVDQDDLITAAAVNGFQPPDALRADQFFLNGVRLPYQRFPRNPFG
jgi:uncharacterized protein GlcG (DUF336 family)